MTGRYEVFSTCRQVNSFNRSGDDIANQDPGKRQCHARSGAARRSSKASHQPPRRLPRPSIHFKDRRFDRRTSRTRSKLEHSAEYPLPPDSGKYRTGLAVNRSTCLVKASFSLQTWRQHAISIRSSLQGLADTIPARSKSSTTTERSKASPTNFPCGRITGYMDCQD